MQVELVSPELIVFSGEATMVICRAEGGDIAFLDNHAPFLGTLEAGEVRVLREREPDVRVTIGGGFVEVRDNRVILLSDDVELAEPS